MDVKTRIGARKLILSLPLPPLLAGARAPNGAGSHIPPRPVLYLTRRVFEMFEYTFIRYKTRDQQSRNREE